MKKFLLFIVLILFLPIECYAKRGCCSWHGGVSHCGDNGRYVCNDGTYSPSCTCTPTVTYKYGCTNSDALNYNAYANRDDGSCIYKVYGCMNSDAINYNTNANIADGSCLFEDQIIEEVEIPYEVVSETGKKSGIKQKGINGKKKIITKNVIDELDKVISSEVTEEVIIEPVNEIRIEKIEPLFEEKQAKDISSSYQKEENNDDGVSGFSILLAIIFTIFGVYKLKK